VWAPVKRKCFGDIGSLILDAGDPYSPNRGVSGFSGCPLKGGEKGGAFWIGGLKGF